MPHQHQTGIVAAAVTPRNRNEEIDFGAGFELIDFLWRGGVNGIAFFTAVGEYASLAPADRARFLCLAVKRSRLPVYVGIGAATFDAVCGLARDARDAGADALLLPPPHGFAYEQDDLREFYMQFSAHSEDMPPVYLIDSRGLCSPIEPGTASELIERGGFTGIADFLSETACAVPELVVRFHASDADRARAMLDDFEAWTREFPAAVAIKTALELRGIKTGPLTVPLTARKRRRLEEFRAWFTAWLPAAKKLAAHA
jgi:dihydrodipicolinate synthase/N-acetylneuraminate lyase